MSDVIITAINTSFIRIAADKSTIYDIASKLIFEAPNVKHDKRVKAGLWDGKIGLLNKRERTLPYGLKYIVEQFCKENDLSFEDRTLPNNDKDQVDQVVEKWMDTLPKKIGNNPFERREYQVQAIKDALQYRRATVKMPTSGGKSLSIYGIVQNTKGKSLVIVPTVGLVTQMANDFKNYGYTNEITQIYSNSKTNNKDDLNDITISTWQSLRTLTTQSPEWFEQFNVVVGDEAQGAKAAVVKKVIELCSNAVYKIGTTGTIPSDPLSYHTIIGLFGPEIKTISVREMIGHGFAPEVDLWGIKVVYNKESQQLFKRRVDKSTGKITPPPTYPQESQWVANHKKRNQFISKLCSNLKGNTLILFKHRSYEGIRDLLKMLEQTGRTVYYVDGFVGTEQRAEIKQAIEEATDAIFVASFKTSGVGMSINRLHNMILISPSKSEINVPQFLGRGLRKAADKQKLLFIDIGDFITGKNYLWIHFEERLKTYMELGLKPRFKTIAIE